MFPLVSFTKNKTPNVSDTVDLLNAFLLSCKQTVVTMLYTPRCGWLNIFIIILLFFYLACDKNKILFTTSALAIEQFSDRRWRRILE